MPALLAHHNVDGSKGKIRSQQWALVLPVVGRKVMYNSKYPLTPIFNQLLRIQPDVIVSILDNLLATAP